MSELEMWHLLAAASDDGLVPSSPLKHGRLFRGRALMALAVHTGVRSLQTRLHYCNAHGQSTPSVVPLLLAADNRDGEDYDGVEDENVYGLRGDEGEGADCGLSQIERRIRR